VQLEQRPLQVEKTSRARETANTPNNELGFGPVTSRMRRGTSAELPPQLDQLDEQPNGVRGQGGEEADDGHDR
jgi:hypothetical protein